MSPESMRISGTLESQHRERQSRLTGAFVDAAVATDAALDAVLAAVYRQLPDRLAHVKRVAWLAVQIGRELKLTARALQDLERAALVHDLGRLVIPDPVNTSPVILDLDQSTEQLFACAAVVSAVPFLARAADVVLASRECMDGTGVPFGLRDEAISLEARILHVADAFDIFSIMCSKFAVHPDMVNVEMVRQAAARFDADVVAACLRCSEIRRSSRRLQYLKGASEAANGRS